MKKCLLTLLLLSPVVLHAQSSPDAIMEVSTVSLYDHAVVQQGKPEDEPSLSVFQPLPGKGNGSSVIIAPGGGYILLASNLEGRQVADWFAARGFTAFVLKYRLGKQNIFPVPLLDAQRAVRVVRSLAPKYRLDPNRIGFVGFSAGGHLAAAAATLFHAQTSGTTDVVDSISDRPDFVVLGYPWINAMQPLPGKGLNYCGILNLKDAALCQKLTTDYGPTLHVTPQTPPTFLYATSDDKVVPVSASTDYYTALVKAGVSAEMHIFRHGEHGSGLGLGDAALDLWPVLLEQWLRDGGYMTKAQGKSSAH